MENNIILSDSQGLDRLNILYSKSVEAIRHARAKVATTVNIAMVELFWKIGSYIVEEEQQGVYRAQYGKKIIEKLAEKLNREFGKGFNVRNLESARRFYIAYPLIADSNFDLENPATALPKSHLPVFKLSWAHYKTLLKINNPEIRNFYEIEAIKHCWSFRELERQIASLLFERLSQNKDKEKKIKKKS